MKRFYIFSDVHSPRYRIKTYLFSFLKYLKEATNLSHTRNNVDILWNKACYFKFDK